MFGTNRHTLTGFITVAALICAGCRQVTPPPLPNVVVKSVSSLPTDLADAAWSAAPQYTAKLILQDLVEPRLLEASTSEVRVRAMSDGDALACRMEWDDASANDLPGPEQFLDACAIQLPATTEPTVPAPQMGDVGRPVEISYWNAAFQAMVDGRDDSLSALYPNAAVDHYPFEAKSLDNDPAAQREMAARYAPARALGNLRAGPRESPVEDLVADGPSTLTRAPSHRSKGRGVRTATGWDVVIVRPLPTGFTAETPTQVAFAVWQGEAYEVGARKMRTGWIPLTLEAAP
jgi:DMSO reductase family type II enzyme heme b subunit